MKNILIILGISCLQIVFGKVTQVELPPTHRECLKELNVAVDLLFTNFHEDFTVTEDIPEFNNVILCAFRKGNFLNADDSVDNAKLHNFLENTFMKIANIKVENPEEAATNAIENCKTVQGTDHGDTLVKNYNCIIKFLRKLERL